MSEEGGTVVLPDEVIASILTRIPAKSVSRFKCVSKTWNSIICNPQFISSYIIARFPSSWLVVDEIIRVNSESNEVSLNIVQPPDVSIFSINHHIYNLDEPSLDSNPCVISSSNGFLLFALHNKRDPYKEHQKNPNCFSHIRTEYRLVVANPITREWIPLLKPENSLNNLEAIGFISRVDSVGVVERFLVVEYMPVLGAEFAFVKIFSSETGKWEFTDGNSMFKNYMWRPMGAFEFDGNLCWIDLSLGIVALDDAFAALEGNKKEAFRLITLPRECWRSSKALGLKNERWIGVAEGFILFLELSEGKNGLKLWRLKDYQGGEWSLVHRVSFVDIWCDESFLACGLKKAMPRPLFIHPFQANIAFFVVENLIFSVNINTKKVESCGDSYSSLTDYLFVMQVVLPSWPTSLPRCLNAALVKEQGNEYFKDNKFDEAIGCYTRSIAVSPSAVAYGNRAMAYLKVRRFHDVEDDCTRALNLDAKFVKAYARRATARKELGNLEGSMEDVTFALELEPHNHALEKQYAVLKSLLQKESSTNVNAVEEVEQAI